MKKIALISDGWKRLITYAWVHGIMQRIKADCLDICLEQYNCYGNWSSDKKHNQGEYNIYNLPELDTYDGIILDCNNITDQDLLAKLIAKLKDTGVPVVSLTYAIDGFYYAGIDNQAPIFELMDHLYYQHKCRTFIYAGGPEDNYENIMRLEAFRSSLKKFQLDESGVRIMYGDYDFDTGVRYMQQLVDEKVTLPDAIVCVNDNIAAGICMEAENHGLRVPDDVLVTGFDNLDKAAFFRPQITTVAHNREEIAEAALQILLDLWDGEDVAQFRFVSSKCIYGESCGCPNNGLVDYREYVKGQITYGVTKQNEDERLVALEGRMAECRDFPEMFREISDYFNHLDCDGFAIVVDKRLFDADIETRFSVEGYEKENLTVAYVTEDHKVLDGIHSVSDLYLYHQNRGSQSAYMFTPIHFREKSIGFTVMKNGNFLYDNPYFYDIHSTFVRSLENLYKQKQMERVNDRMKELYNRDPLTGLFNRIAYTEMIMPRFANYCKSGISCAMAFFDVDYFKQINDTLGHKYGDELLKLIARTLEEKRPGDGYAYRFGGDEFVVFFPNATEDKIEKFKRDVTEELMRHKVSVSIGVIVTDPHDSKTLDEYLVLADQKMYEVKSARKANRK